MTQVNSTEFQNKPGLYQDLAQKEPVTITKHNRPFVVLLSFDEYQRLMQNKQRRFHVSALSDDELARIADSKVDPKHRHLDEELDR